MDTRSFLWPVFRGEVVVVTRYREEQVEWNTYILPFSHEMWLVIFLWMVLCDITVAFVEFASRRKKTGNSFRGHIKEFLFSTAFTYCNQGISVPSKLLTSRIVILMMFVVPGVLFPGYSAILTSFLTVKLQKQPFRSLEELTRTDEYKVGWHRDFAMNQVFNLNGSDPVIRALLKNNVLPQDKLLETDAEGIEKMCKEKFSYLKIRDTLLALKPKCNFYRLPQPLRVIFASIELQKGSWYKFLMDRCERILHYCGALVMLKRRSVFKLVRYDKVFVIASYDVEAIKRENIVMPFAMLLLGVVTSVFLLVLEVVWSKLNSA